MKILSEPRDRPEGENFQPAEKNFIAHTPSNIAQTLNSLLDKFQPCRSNPTTLNSFKTPKIQEELGVAQVEVRLCFSFLSYLFFMNLFNVAYFLFFHIILGLLLLSVSFLS